MSNPDMLHGLSPEQLHYFDVGLGYYFYETRKHERMSEEDFFNRYLATFPEEDRPDPRVLLAELATETAISRMKAQEGVQ